MRSIAMLAAAAALAASVPLTAIAQTEPNVVHHHVYHHVYPPHHTVHHHYVAHGPAVAPASAPIVAAPPQSGPFGLSLPHIAPYPAGKGDEDGLSGDTDDCNKGCVDGTSN